MTDSEATKQLETIYDTIEDAFRRKDLDKILSYMAPEYQGTTPEGKSMTREDLAASLRTQFENMTVTSWHRSITSLDLVGDIATLTVEGAFKATKDGARLEPVEMQLVNQDTWKCDGTTWQMTASKALNSP